jgi:hypothetical protein
LSGNHTVTCEAGEVIESETNYACGVARPDVGHAVDDDLAGGHDERRKHRRTRRLFAALNCSIPSNGEGGWLGKGGEPVLLSERRVQQRLCRNDMIAVLALPPMWT